MSPTVLAGSRPADNTEVTCEARGAMNKATLATLAAWSIGSLACGETTGLALSAGGPVTGVVTGTITDCGAPASGVQVVLAVRRRPSARPGR